MKRDEKFTPVITLVVYCGTEHAWDGAKCLYDLLDINEEMKEFVSNYRLNLYDCHEHDTFDEYHTGLRPLFETVRYGKDKEQLKKVMDENKEIYNNIDRDTREVLAVVANVRIPEECKVMKDGEERLIAEELEMDLTEVEEIVAAQQKVGNYDMEAICKVMN